MLMRWNVYAINRYLRNEGYDMLEKIKNVPNRKLLDVKALQRSELPLIIYGIGSYAHDVTKFLNEHGIHLDGACVDAEYLQFSAASFRGLPVLSLEKISDNYRRFNLLIGFADYRSAREKTNHIAGIVRTYFIDAPNHLDFFDYDYIVKNIAKFEQSYEYLSDTLSKQTFIAFINAKISGQPGWRERRLGLIVGQVIPAQFRGEDKRKLKQSHVLLKSIVAPTDIVYPGHGAPQIFSMSIKYS